MAVSEEREVQEESLPFSLEVTVHNLGSQTVIALSGGKLRAHWPDGVAQRSGTGVSDRASSAHNTPRCPPPGMPQEYLSSFAALQYLVA